MSENDMPGLKKSVHSTGLDEKPRDYPDLEMPSSPSVTGGQTPHVISATPTSRVTYDSDNPNLHKCLDKDVNEDDSMAPERPHVGHPANERAIVPPGVRDSKRLENQRRERHPKDIPTQEVSY